MKKRQSREGICRVDGCRSPIKAKRLCEKHYARQRRNGTLETVTVDKELYPLCIAFDCNEPSHTKGLCSYHYNNYKKYKTPYLPVVIRLCRVEGCGNVHQARGLCQKHYHDWNKLLEELEINL